MIELKHVQKVIGPTTVVGIALMVPSWFTIMTIPALLQAVLRLVPTQYMMHALNLSLTQANSLRPASPDLAVLACSTVLTFGLVAWWLQRSENRGM